MMYLYIKTIHVFAVVILIAGMLAMALVLRIAAERDDDGESRRLYEAILSWDGFATTPALGVVWMAGFTMAFGAGWETALWLSVKMIPVIFLTGLHTLEGRALKRLLQEGKRVNPKFRAAPATILATFAFIAWLAVTKPI